MAEQRVTVLVCDEPITSKANEPCSRPAVGTVRLVINGRNYDKDLCEGHIERYQLGARYRRGPQRGRKR